MDFLKNINLEALPRKRHIAIKYMLDHAAEVISMNMADLAKQLNVDPVTINKSCQDIGLKGFHDLKQQLKKSGKANSSLSPVQKFLSEFEVNTSTEEAIRNALSRDLEMLTGTIGKVSFDKLIEAARAIIASRQTYVIGLGYIGAVANYLQSLVRSHVPQIHAITEYNGMLFDYMQHFGKGDVVLAIGFDKCQNQTIKAFKKAKERGAFTIVLTDSEYSALCQYARTELLVYTAPKYFLSPLIGAFSICNALLHCVVELTKPQSTRRSAAYNKLLQEENVYYLE